MNRSRTWRALLLAALAGVGGCMSDMDSFVQGGGGIGGIGGAGGMLGAGGSGGTGGTCAAQCCEPTDCPAPDQVCVARTCVDGSCGETVVLEGQESPWQTPNDCRKYLCNADGDSDWTHDELDPLNDGIQCTVDVCVNGTPANTPVDAGTPCNQAGGKYCNSTKECVACTDNMHCPGQMCSTANQCVPLACNNGMKDANETDVDCGGPCKATCETDESCLVDGDCVDGICQGNVCAAPTCQDGLKNGFETDVDCGGNCADKCQPMQHCQTGTDCLGNQCSGSVCVPNCQDGVKNNAETGVDCGGPNCGECAVGEECQVSGDCLGGHCIDGVCCDTACIGECLACSSVKTGAPDGACAPIAAGTDPDNDCDPEPGLACGNTTGFCGGNGYCEKQPDGTVCGPVVADSCAGGSQTTADACDGLGTCVASTTTTCSPYVCGATACLTSCAGDADCEGTSYCAGSQCVPKNPNGYTCNAANECSSGSCVDGVCCNTACGGGATGDCQACNVAGSEGTCVPLAGGTVCRAATGVCDTQEVCDGSGVDCPADGVASAATVCRPAADVCDVTEMCNGIAKTCPADGFSPAATQCRPQNGDCDVAELCSGNGPDCPADAVRSAGTVCRAAVGQCDLAEVCDGTQKTCPANGYQPVNTPCGSTQSCSSSVQTNQDRCNSTGTCVDFGTTACAPYYCANNLACDTNCSTHSECQPGYYCNAPQCVAKRPNGQVCASGPECQSGNCVDGVCCNTSCGASSASDCQACNVPGSVGTCTFLGANTVCRSAAGLCDQTEYCTGSSVNCPADLNQPNGFVCRASGGGCDPAETCNGSAKTCPSDTIYPNGYVCRSSMGTCDVQETCNGVAPTCPSDGYRPQGFLCSTPFCVGTTLYAADMCNGAGTCNVDGGSTVCQGGCVNGQCTPCQPGSKQSCCYGANCTPGEETCSSTGNWGNCVELRVLAVDPGYSHTCAVLNDGRVKCWGANDSGQLGYGDTVNRGDNQGEMGAVLPAVQLGTGKYATAVSAGGTHTCAILNDGSVKCWGWNQHGQLGVGLGNTFNRGDHPNEMGDNLPAVNLGTGKTAVAIAAGSNHSCAILNDGGVKCWGMNVYGQLGLGNTQNRGVNAAELGDNLPVVALGTGKTATSISAGESHTCAILNDSTVKCWGYNYYGQLGLGDRFSRGDQAGEMGDSLPTVDLGVGPTVVAITAGRHHNCARINNGNVKCWGWNNGGQLGQGNTQDRGDDTNEMGNNLAFVDFGTLTAATHIAAGLAHTCARLSGGGTKCWGSHYYGERGTGSTTATNEAVKNLPGVNLNTQNVNSLMAGGPHTCALYLDGSIKCWGANFAGQLGLGDINNRGDEWAEMGVSLTIVKLFSDIW